MKQFFFPKLRYRIFIALILITITYGYHQNNVGYAVTRRSCNCVEEVLDKVRKNKINNCTIITISNYGFKELTLNWIKSLEKNNYHKFVVFSFDEELYDYLKQKGYSDRTTIVPSDWLEFELTKLPTNFGNKDYNKITQSKVHVHYNLLLNNITFLMSDVDIVWLSSHIVEYIEYNLRHSYAHMAFSQDTPLGAIQYNTGLFYAQTTKFTLNLFLNWINEQRVDVSKSIDQFVLDSLLAKNSHSDSRIYPLDKLLFSSGEAYFHQKANDKFGIKPLTVHANYIVSMKNKIEYLKKSNLWYL